VSRQEELVPEAGGAVVTASEVVELLRARHTKPGNGGSGEYAFFTEVRDGAAHSATISIDAVTMSLWPSRGLAIEGWEVKVSRSDWRRELMNPAKAEAACKVVDKFWVVAPRGVVAEGELPEAWGLLMVQRSREGLKLKLVKEAHWLGSERTRRQVVSRDFLVGLLRSCSGAIPGGRLDPNVAAVEQARHDEKVRLTAAFRVQAQGYRDRAEQAEAAIREFERRAGVKLSSFAGEGASPERVAAVAEALKAALTGDHRIRDVRKQMAGLARQLREQAAVLERLAREDGAGDMMVLK
jgi:hypothetical protein